MRKSRVWVCAIGMLCLWGLPAVVLGSGFAIPEQGPKANAMGGAFVAQADDPTALYYNPAGIVQLEGTHFDLPGVLYLGAAWTQEAWTVEFDAHMTGWSAYDQLALDFEMLPDRTIAKDWKDSWAYRLGLQYRLNDDFDLRAGIVFDDGPIPGDTLDPIVPSGDRWIYTLGGGYHHGGWTVDFSYAYVDDDGGEFDNDAGDYTAAFGGGGRVTGRFTDVDCHIVGVSVTYRF